MRVEFWIWCVLERSLSRRLFFGLHGVYSVSSEWFHYKVKFTGHGSLIAGAFIQNLLMNP